MLIYPTFQQKRYSNKLIATQIQVDENERAQQTVNMMGAPSTSEYQQGFIPYDPIRSFLQFNIMQQQPQFYSQQEDRKDFNVGKEDSTSTIFIYMNVFKWTPLICFIISCKFF
jgi:MADS-box transcription factor, plant